MGEVRVETLLTGDFRTDEFNLAGLVYPLTISLDLSTLVS